MTDSKKERELDEVVSPKQKRAFITRSELLDAARTIFARDGFEHARLEDIASLAGKTRGAFYANFRDKEDVFFAIFEDNVDREQAELVPLLRDIPTLESRIAALGGYLEKLTKDSQRTLLNLEFKLYAIRHPNRRKRLADLHAAMRLRMSLPEVHSMFPEFTRQSVRERTIGTLAVGGVLDGLALNRLFDPEAVEDKQQARYITLCLREAILRNDAATTSA